MSAVDVRIVFRDEDFLVVDKPTGMATTSPDGRDCLAEVVRRLDPHAPRLHATSRLDAEVTGIVTFARTTRGIEHSLAMRRAGSYVRTYVALASSPPGLPVPSPSAGAWTGAIAVDPRDARRRVVATSSDARPSQTDYRVAFASASGVALELHPRTGRTHQLRVHASAAGAALLGDVHYGGAKRITQPNGRVVTAARVMLHCACVELPLPAGGMGRFIAPLPSDFRVALESLGTTTDAVGWNW